MAELERRLERAKPGNRAQYLRIKAVEIQIGTDDPAAWKQSAGLARRVIAVDPEGFEAPICHAVLGDYHRRFAEWDDALAHYQTAIDLTAPSRSRSRGTEEVDMAEVLVSRGGPGDFQRAIGLLRSEAITARPQFNSTLFRIYVTEARARHAIGQDPSSAAAEALRLASITDPQLPRHPTVGIVHADDATLKELRNLASASR
jgi:hypothetical protein